MAALKAGTVYDFENSLAAEIEAAMQSEWLTVKGTELPSPVGEQDRRILFVAIARGVLKFLTDHRLEVPTTAAPDGHTHTIEWDYV